MTLREFPVTDISGQPIGRISLTERAIDAAEGSYESVALTPGCLLKDGRAELREWILTFIPAVPGGRVEP